MDETAVHEGPAAEGPTEAFARRASIVFLFEAVLLAVVALIVAAPSGATGPALAVTMALAAVLAIASLVMAAALRRRRSWAPASALVVLVVVLVLGLARAVITLTTGSVYVPADAILAGWALHALERPLIRVGDMHLPGVVLAAVLLIGVVGSTFTAPAKPVIAPPPSDPARAIMVTNLSPHAVLVSTRGLLSTPAASNEAAASHDVAVRSCGGTGTLFTGPADLTSDGRLMVFVSIDQTGSFDAALAAAPGDGTDLAGRFWVSPIWSRGDLADRLPLHLTVAPDGTVDETTPAPAASAPACLPAF